MILRLPEGLLRLDGELPAGLHPEAALLARCRAAGLPVPVGAVLLAGHDDLGPLAPGAAVTLRVLGAHAGVRLSTQDPAALAAAARGAGGDLVVLRAVASVHAGRAWTGVRTNAGTDTARAVEGEAHGLDGASDVRSLMIPALTRSWQRAHRGADPWRTPLPPWGMRLARLLRDVRRILGPGPWELTWADDGRTCRLIGVLPG